MANFSSKHEKFIQGILEGKTEMQAYIDAGYSARTAKNNAYRLMENDGIKREIETRVERINKAANIHLKYKSLNAAKTMTELVETGTPNDFCRLSAAKDVMDRTGLKPTEKVEHTGELTHIFKGMDIENYPEQDE